MNGCFLERGVVPASQAQLRFDGVHRCPPGHALNVVVAVVLEVDHRKLLHGASGEAGQPTVQDQAVIVALGAGVVGAEEKHFTIR